MKQNNFFKNWKLIFSILFITLSSNAQIVTSTLAGKVGTLGTTNGNTTGTPAEFIYPRGIVIGPDGNIYVSDQHRVRKITPAGVVSFYAGDIAPGTNDGTGSFVGLFYGIVDIVFDSTGNLFVLEQAPGQVSAHVRKVTPAGVISTVAGSGTTGSNVVTDGTGLAATFNSVKGITVDAADNLYVTDQKCVRKITQAGVVTTWIGTGVSGQPTGTFTNFAHQNFFDLVFDANGNLFLTDVGSNTIVKITSTGVGSIIAGSTTQSGTTNGNGTVARFNLPQGITIDSNGSLYIVDSNNHRIRKMTTAGDVTTLIGSTQGSVNTTGALSTFNLPTMLTLANSGQVIYLSDSGNYLVRKIEIQPAAPTANAQTFCNGATVADLVATGDSGATIKWYSQATGGTALILGQFLGTATLYAAQVLNTVESPRTAVTITVNTTAQPTASNQAICGSGTVTDLVATGTALKWYNTSTGGLPLASTTALAAGTYYVTQTLNTCESFRKAISVTINAIPASPAASAQTKCSPSYILSLTPNTFNVNKWYSAATGGTALASNTLLATGTYYVSQTVSGCEGTRTSVVVTINTTTPPTATSPQNYSPGANITALFATGTLLKWYSASTGGTALVSTTALVNNTTYYVSDTQNTCESTRTPVLALDTTLTNVDFEISNMKIYPNPSNGIFNIDTNSNAIIEVFDIVGKQIISRKIELGATQLDLSNYNDGIYLLKVTNADNQTKTVKIVKQ
jgi:hypothetical protein